MKYQYLLFDFDGTITNSKEGVVKSVEYALRSFGIETADREELVRFIGPPLRESFRKFYGMSAGQAEEAVAKYRERYREKGVWENEIYPGAPELLAKLQSAGLTIALATSKPTVFARMALKQHELEQYFDLIVGSELDGTRDKKTDVIAEVLRLLELDEEKRSQTVMIGDRHHDILGGKEFSLATIGLRLGFAEEGELENCRPDFIAADYAELETILLGN